MLGRMLPSSTPSMMDLTSVLSSATSRVDLPLPPRDAVLRRCSALAGSCAQQKEPCCPVAAPLHRSPLALIAWHCGVNSLPPASGPGEASRAKFPREASLATVQARTLIGADVVVTNDVEMAALWHRAHVLRSPLLARGVVRNLAAPLIVQHPDMGLVSTDAPSTPRAHERLPAHTGTHSSHRQPGACWRSSVTPVTELPFPA